MQLLGRNLMISKTINQFFLFSEPCKPLDQSNGFFIARAQYSRTYQVHNGQGKPKEGNLSCVQQMIPEFESAFEAERPTEDSEEPLHKVSLRINLLLLKVERDLLVTLEKEVVEGSSQDEDEVGLKSEQSFEEWIDEHHVGENSKGLHLPHCDGEDNDRVGHSLDVADIRPIEVEEFEHLCYIFSKSHRRLVLRSSSEGAANVSAYLALHLLRHPLILSPLQEFEVKFI